MAIEFPCVEVSRHREWFSRWGVWLLPNKRIAIRHGNFCSRRCDAVRRANRLARDLSRKTIPVRLPEEK